MGAWATYALGTENQDLPAFVAIPDMRGLPPNGPANWNAGFLPAAYQGTAFNTVTPIANLNSPPGATPQGERQARDLLSRLNSGASATASRSERSGSPHRRLRTGGTDAALRAGSDRPGPRDGGDPDFLRRGQRQSAQGRVCPELHLARRLLEKGVRFVQLYCGACASGVDGLLNWDAHKTLKADYERHGAILDQPTAALLQDLNSAAS